VLAELPASTYVLETELRPSQVPPSQPLVTVWTLHTGFEILAKLRVSAQTELPAEL
jgi:hypothetical protein